MNLLEDRTKRHEGFRDKIYLDSEGFPTGGWGHHFYPGSRLPLEVCEALFKQDLASAVSDFMKISSSMRNRLDLVRRRVIVEMIFNMGLQRVLQFRKMWGAIELEDFSLAAKEMLDSKWADQTKFRAIELAEIMRLGVDTDVKS